MGPHRTHLRTEKRPFASSVRCARRSGYDSPEHIFIFILFPFIWSFIPKGYVDPRTNTALTKETRHGLCRALTKNKGGPPLPSVRHAQSSGYGSPLTRGGWRRGGDNSCVLLRDPLLRLPRYPSIQSRRPFLLLTHIIHHPSHSRIPQEANETPFLARAVQKHPDAPRLFAFPCFGSCGPEFLVRAVKEDMRTCHFFPVAEPAGVALAFSDPLEKDCGPPMACADLSDRPGDRIPSFVQARLLGWRWRDFFRP